MCSDRGQGPGELEALTRMGVPHRIGWGHSWLSLAGPELGAEIEIKLLFIKCWPFGDTCYRSYGLPSCIITRDNNPTSYESDSWQLPGLIPVHKDWLPGLVAVGHGSEFSF